jgi:hypothetical protein
MKSFRLYLRPSISQPRRVASDYSAEQLANFREKLRPLARLYRCAHVILYIVVALGFSFLVLNEVLPRSFSPWVAGGFWACLVSFLALFCLCPPLLCPACQNRLERGRFGSYCPECGAKGLQTKGWFRSPWCPTCRQRIRCGRGQYYKTRACTYCGVPLDERGLPT